MTTRAAALYFSDMNRQAVERAAKTATERVTELEDENAQLKAQLEKLGAQPENHGTPQTIQAEGMGPHDG